MWAFFLEQINIKPNAKDSWMREKGEMSRLHLKCQLYIKKQKFVS